MKRIYHTFIIGFIIVTLQVWSGVSTSRADVLLPGYPERAQEHSQWCWAGSSESVIEYYGTSVNQCDIANWAWGRADCCGNTDFNWSHACNQPNYMYGATGSLQDILIHWGVNNTAVGSYLSITSCVSEIGAGRPFVMRFGWTSGGGHFLAGYGYDRTSGDYLDYMDPWPGNGYTRSLYSWVVSAADHTWTHTLQVTTNPSCTYSLDPAASPLFGASGGSGSFNVTTQSGCAWTASESLAWVTITSGASGTGSGTVTYNVAANPGAQRSGAIVVTGQSFSGQHTVSQAGTAGTPDLAPYQRVNWNDKIPIGITPLSGSGEHNYSGPYYDNQTLYFNWSSINQGTAASVSYTVRAEVTGTGGGTWTWSIPSNDIDQYWWLGTDRAVGPLSAGTHTFKVWVDYYNTVNEGSNEGNNYYERTITVRDSCDFNNDGRPDIVWRNASTGELVAWFMNGINMTSWSYFNPSPVHTAWKTVGTGDVNGDGNPDIVLRNSWTGDLAVWFMNGVNMTSWSYLNPSPVHTAWKVVGVEDFNSDGKPDVLWRNYSTGEFAVWFMNGVNMTSSNYFNPSPIDIRWETVGTGDFNADGKPDVLWRNYSTGEFVVWFMNGINMTSWSYFNPSPVHTSWETVGTKDLNGDGKLDVLWRNTVTGEFAVWFMNGINMTSSNYFNPSPVNTIWVPMGSRWNTRFDW